MILDKIENAERYKGINELLYEGLKFLAENDFKETEIGKFYLKDDMLYAMVNEYETKAENECKLESHKKYIDIQFIVKGRENIGYTIYKGQEPTVPYNSEKDVTFYEEDVNILTLKEGMFAVFFPDDLHQPGIEVGGKAIVKKVVVKVRV